jgi:hypothetical protein
MASGSTCTFQRVQTQFIAADPGMGNPQAKSGSGANEWGLWRVDPGPRGVRLHQFVALEKNGGVAPAGWKFSPDDWWLEEHGLIMEAPEMGVLAGRYMLAVLNGAEKGGSAVLTVDGDRWSLDSGATLDDVTHRPCRSGRYAGGLPSAANPRDFPVPHGAEMPAVPGCAKVDYAVLFVVGVEK